MTDHDTTQSDLQADQLAAIASSLRLLPEALRLGLVTMVDDPPEDRDDRNVVDGLYAVAASIHEAGKAIAAELSAVSYATAHRPVADTVYDFSDPGPG